MAEAKAATPRGVSGCQAKGANGGAGGDGAGDSLEVVAVSMAATADGEPAPQRRAFPTASGWLDSSFAIRHVAVGDSGLAVGVGGD